MAYIAVHARVRQQHEDMRPAPAAVGGRGKNGIFEKASVGYGIAYAQQALIYHAPRADIGVADLAVAHGALGQADMGAGGLESAVGAAAPQRVEIRGGRGSDRVAAAAVRQAEAVHYYKRYGCFHCSAALTIS